MAVIGFFFTLKSFQGMIEILEFTKDSLDDI